MASGFSAFDRVLQRIDAEGMGEAMVWRFATKSKAYSATVVGDGTVQIGGRFYNAEKGLGEQGDTVAVVNVGRPGAAVYGSAASAVVAQSAPVSAGGSGGGGSSGGGMVAHALNSAYHSGILSKTQAPWALAADGTVAMTGNLRLDDGLTVDGVDVSAHVADVNAHHVKQHALDDAAHHKGTLPWAWLDKTGSSLAHLAIRNHGDLQGVSTNQHHNQVHDIVGGDHEYVGGQDLDVFGLTALSTLGRLRPSADVSAGASALLRSNGGGLVIKTLTATTKVRTPLIDTALGDMALRPAGDLVLDPGDSDVIIPVAKTLRADNYLSGFPLAGFRIGETQLAGQSGLKIGVVEADELRVRIFVADETRVDRGQQYITKSYGLLSRPFLGSMYINVPTDIYFENSPNLGTDGALFTDGDWVLLRYLDIDTGVDLLNCWGQVYGPPVFGYSPDAVREQMWTFMRRYGTPSLAFNKGAMAINFGAEGQGYILSSAVGDDAPFVQVGAWIVNPYAPGTRSVYAQLGRLDGVGFTGQVGLAATRTGFGVSGQWIKVGSGGAAFNNIDSSWRRLGITTALIESGGRARFGTDVSADATTFLDIDPDTATATFRGAIEILSGSIPNAKIDGLGTLATKSNVSMDADVTDGTTYKRYAATEKTKLAGVATGATAGAVWGANLTGQPVELMDGRIATALNAAGTVLTRVVPGATASASASGLYLGSDRMGFYNGSAWRTYMDDTGKFYLTGTGSNALAWDGANLSITGTITLTNSIPNTKVTGLGTLSTKSAVDLATADVTNKTLANIADGGGYGRVNSTIIAAGNIRIGSGSTAGANLSGFELTSTEIRGAASNVTQVQMGVDGKLKAGGGNVWLDAAGFRFRGTMNDSAETYDEFVRSETLTGKRVSSLSVWWSGVLETTRVRLAAFDSASQHMTNLTLEAGTAASVGTIYAGGNVQVSGTMNVPQGGWGTGYSFYNATTSFMGTTTYGGMSVQGKYVFISYVAGANPSFLKLGLGNATSAAASLEFYTDGATPTTYNAKIVSNLGPTGSLEIRNVGSGNMDLWQEGAGQIRLITSGAQRVAVSAAGDMTQSTGTFTAPIVNTTTTYKRDGVAGGIFVPLPSGPQLWDGTRTWNGGTALGAGTYYFDMQHASNGSIPAEAIAVVVSMMGKWSGANDSYYCILAPKGGQFSLVVRSQEGNVTQDAMGIVLLGTGGDIQAVIAGAVSNTYPAIRLHGYFM